MVQLPTRVTVAVCETQPVTVEGIKAVLSECPDLEMIHASQSLVTGAEVLQTRHPRTMLLDKAFGIHSIVQWMIDQRQSLAATAVAVWGVSINESEALRFIQAGAKGVVRKTATPSALVNCLRSIANGSTWMEDSIFRDSLRRPGYSHSDLTPRELQVLSLVEQGLKNSEIAIELGIRPGTVKIHLKHIFEKTGVRDRYGLALSGLRHKSNMTLTV